MRILSIGFMYPPHDLGGGYEVTWRSSVRHMRASGHDVRVLASDFRRADAGPAGELDADVHRELRTYWQDHDFPRLRLRERLELERQNGEVLRRHLEEMRPDAVNWWAMGGMSLSLVEIVRRRGTPAVGIVGDDWLDWGPRVDAWMRFVRRIPGARAAERRLGVPTRLDLDDAATWLFNSETVRRKALRTHPGLGESRVVHPGIDAGLFGPAPPRPWSWRLLYLGRFDRRKGVHVAIEALRHLPAEANLTLQGAGDDEYLRELHSLVATHGLESRVSFSTAAREDLPRVYAESDAVLFPVQWDEPWGLVPLEAMTVGRPVVASGTGGSSEYLRNEENCLIYAPRDSSQALAAAVRRLADDAALRARIVTAGRSTAAPFTETAYNEAILAATVQAAGSRAAPRGAGVAVA